jgi:hypothetical protein
MEKSIEWFDSPDEASDRLDRYYETLTPQQRLDEMIALLNNWGKWKERRLERVAQFIQLP